MNAIRTILDSGILRSFTELCSSVMALCCAVSLGYYQFTGKGTERDLLITIGLLLLALCLAVNK